MKFHRVYCGVWIKICTNCGTKSTDMGKPKRNYSSTLTWQLGHWEIVPLLPFGVSQVSLAFPKICKSSLFKRTDWKMTFPFLGKCVELPHHRGRWTSEWFPSFFIDWKIGGTFSVDFHGVFLCANDFEGGRCECECLHKCLCVYQGVSVCMCVCVEVCMWVSECVCMCMCVCACVCVCEHTCVYTIVYICHVYTYVHDLYCIQLVLRIPCLQQVHAFKESMLCLLDIG